MNDNRRVVEAGGKVFHLVGTAHVSRESIDEVRTVIEAETPDVVCVELDEGRYKQMFDGNSAAAWEKLDIVKVFREGKGFLLLANLVLSSFQRRIGDSFGVKPGMEMKEAILAARERDIPFVFCDREIQATLNRAWRHCGLWSKCKLLAALLSSAFFNEKPDENEIEQLKKTNELDGMMTELAEFLPEVKETLIDERDRFLAAKIYEAGAAGQKIVAVVGAGHLKGIEAHIAALEKGEESADVASLSEVPPKTALAKALPYLIPVAIVALIAAGFIFVGPKVSGDMLFRWILWNGSLAALGALISLAHPLSIVVAFIGAPIGTLSPVLSIGIFAGIVEASLRRPRVEDVETLSDAVTSLRGIYRNRVTHALLVFFLASIGGAVGNFIAVPTLAARLF